MSCNLKEGTWTIENVNSMGNVGDRVSFVNDVDNRINIYNSEQYLADTLYCSGSKSTNGKCTMDNIESFEFPENISIKSMYNYIQCKNGELVDYNDNTIVYYSSQSSDNSLLLEVYEPLKYYACINGTCSLAPNGTMTEDECSRCY